MKKTHTVELERGESNYWLSGAHICYTKFHELTGIRLRKGQTVKLKFTHLKNGFKAEVVK